MLGKFAGRLPTRLLPKKEARALLVKWPARFRDEIFGADRAEQSTLVFGRMYTIRTQITTRVVQAWVSKISDGQASSCGTNLFTATSSCRTLHGGLGIRAAGHA